MKSALRHKYFELAPKERLRFQFKLIGISLLILIIVICIAIYLKLVVFVPLVFWILLSNLASFIDVPAMVKSGKLRYQSAFLLSERETKNRVVIHGGTLFDYYFCIDKGTTSKTRKVLIVSEYLRGLLHLIDMYRERPELEITGTTYILNARTANKIGFRTQPTNTIQKLILFFNYPSLILANSIVNRALTFPNLNRTKTYTTSIKTLIGNEGAIKAMRQRLLNANHNKIIGNTS